MHITTDHEEERIIKELFADCSPTLQKIIMNAHNKFIIPLPSDENESDQNDSNGEEDVDGLTEEYMGTTSDQTEQERNNTELTDSQQITVTVFNVEEYDSGITSLSNWPHQNNMRNASVYHQYCLYINLCVVSIPHRSTVMMTTKSP